MYQADAFAVSPERTFVHSSEVEVGSEIDFLSSSENSELSPSQRLFDLASLTKVMVTSTLLVDLAQTEGASSLKDWASEYKVADAFESLESTFLADTTLLELWEHRSGLAPVVDLVPARPHFCSLENDRSSAWESCLQQIGHLPTGKKGKTIYSDCGFLVLGAWLEAKTQKRLDQLFAEWLERNLLRTKLSFHLDNKVSMADSSSVMPTEARHLAGEVNDDKAFFLGGVAPHAGLFGTADDVMEFAKHILSLSQGSSLWHEWLFAKPESRFVFGWDTASQKSGSPAGQFASGFVRGHLGYTGTALWMDPKSQKIGVLLSNRVAPQASEINKESIRRLRSLFFDGLWQGTI